MDVRTAQKSVIEGVEGRFDAIGFDAFDSLQVTEVRPDGNAVLEDEQGAQFLLTVTPLPQH